MGDDRQQRLSALSKAALQGNIDRYRAADRNSGGYFTLGELLAEQHRRQKSGTLGTIDTARAILEQAAASPVGVTTYGAVWAALRPGMPWRVFPARGEVTNALERVQFYCFQRGLPLLATLVVNAGEGELTAEAKANIANWARENGIAVGPRHRSIRG